LASSLTLPGFTKEDTSLMNQFNQYIMTGLGALRDELQKLLFTTEISLNDYLYLIFQSDFDIEKYLSWACDDELNTKTIEFFQSMNPDLHFMDSAVGFKRKRMNSEDNTDRKHGPNLENFKRMATIGAGGNSPQSKTSRLGKHGANFTELAGDDENENIRGRGHDIYLQALAKYVSKDIYDNEEIRLEQIPVEEILASFRNPTD
jgi:hypothetical protein